MSGCISLILNVATILRAQIVIARDDVLDLIGHLHNFYTLQTALTQFPPMEIWAGGRGWSADLQIILALLGTW